MREQDAAARRRGPEHGRGVAVRRALAAAGAAGVAAVVVIVVLSAGDDPPPVRAAEPTAATATVERRDLVDRDSRAGHARLRRQLHAGGEPAPARSPACRSRGRSCARGRALYDADNAPAAWLLYGDLPAWRDFNGWMSDGEDVRQLERNLRALGYDSDHDMTIDDDWTSATTAAVERFQDDHGLTEDGTLAKGEVVFRPGPTRVGDVRGDGRAIGRRGRPARRAHLDEPRDHRRPRGVPPGAGARGRRRDGRPAERPQRARAHHRRRQGRRRAGVRRSGSHDRRHDRAARPRRARHGARPGAGRRRLRARAQQGRPRRAGHRAAGPLRRRVRGRGGVERPPAAGAGASWARTPRTTSRSAATACARA